MQPDARPAPLFKRRKRKERRLLDRLRVLAGMKLSSMLEPPSAPLGLAS